jgi:hypothetical protein
MDICFRVVLAASLGLFFLCIGCVSSVYASEIGTTSVAGAHPASAINCADYYSTSSVSVYLDTSIVTIASSTPHTFSGYIKNTNPYPVVGGAVYIKVFKRGDVISGDATEPPLVGEVLVNQNIIVPAYGGVPLSFVWNPPNDSVAGEYQVVPLFTASRWYGAQEGSAHRAQIDFSGVTTFPLNKGQTVFVFSCLRGALGVDVSDVRLDLTLSDTKGNLLHSYSYAGDLSSGKVSVSDVFAPQRDYDVVILDALLYEKGQLVDESHLTYDCNTIDQGLCQNKTQVVDTMLFLSNAANKVLLVFGLMIITLTGAVWLMRRAPVHGEPNE